MTFQIGSRLGHYDVIALIGEGGMGPSKHGHESARSRRD